MNISGPDRRHVSRETRLSIIEKFKWPYEDGMQDWPLEISEKINLAFCFQEYPKLVNDDEKLLLMQGMLYTLDDLEGELFNFYSKKITKLLNIDFELHKGTIYYWTGYPTDSEGRFKITPLMRSIWNTQQK